MRHLVAIATAVLSVTAVLAVPFVSAAVQNTTLAPGDSLNVSCSTSLSLQASTAQRAAILCAAAPTTVPTTVPTPTIAPSAPTAVPTAPVAIPFAPTPAPATIDGVPVCPNPGVNVWHSLVQRSSSGTILCTWGYEMGDDPHQLDKTFGPMGAWWNNGQEQDISYPWETHNENQTKHSAYKIIVRGSDAQPLQPWYTMSGQNYIRRFRGVYHVDGPAGFVMSQYHSFGFEAEICSPNGNCGIARFGGVQDLGERILTHDNGTFSCVFPDPNIPSNQGVCGGSSNLAQVRSMAGGPNDGRRDETWYGSNLVHHQTNQQAIELDFGVILHDVWSPIHLASPMDAMSPDPAVRGDYPPHYKTTPYIPQNVDDWHHGTGVEASAIGLRVNFPAVNGRINASGYTDRFGNEVLGGCPNMGPDCVPFALVNVPAGYEGFRDAEYSQATNTPSQVKNYDVINPATGHSLVDWPN